MQFLAGLRGDRLGLVWARQRALPLKSLANSTGRSMRPWPIRRSKRRSPSPAARDLLARPPTSASSFADETDKWSKVIQAAHVAAWWCRSLDIGRVLRQARTDHGDATKAAAALGVRLVEHAHAVQPAEELVAKLGSRLAQAQRASDLAYLNRAYRAYPLDRVANGEAAMSYRAPRSKLRREITSVAAARRWGRALSPAFLTENEFARDHDDL